MKFWCGCRGCPVVIWIINTSKAIFRGWFFFSPQEGRKIKKKISESAVVIPSHTAPLLTYSEQRPGLSQAFWILYEISGNIQSMDRNRTSSRRWMACLAVFTDGVWGTGEALRVRTLQVLRVGRRSQHLAQIYISHHCSLSFGINFVPGTLWGEGGGLYYCVTADVRGSVCIIDSLPSWIRIYLVIQPFFPRAL